MMPTIAVILTAGKQCDRWRSEMMPEVGGNCVKYTKNEVAHSCASFNANVKVHLKI